MMMMSIVEYQMTLQKIYHMILKERGKCFFSSFSFSFSRVDFFAAEAQIQRRRNVELCHKYG